MGKLFGLLGGRRLSSALVGTVISGIAYKVFPADIAAQVTETGVYLFGAFILGESVQGAASNYKK